MEILDIHSHHAAPYPQGIISIQPDSNFSPLPEQLYTVGLHPWQSADAGAEALLEMIGSLARHPQVAGIGECGIDVGKGAPLFKQMLLLKRQIEISETAGKPLVLHAVKCPDIIIGLHSELNAASLWVVHGFRGKPTVAQMYLRAGIYLSFGEKFNPETLRSIPTQFLLAETDDSPLHIDRILELQAEALSMPVEQYRRIIADNTLRFLQNRL